MGATPESGTGGELLTLTQAASYLDISKSTLYRLLDQGRIRGFKVGRQWRFREEDLEAYLTRSPVAMLDVPQEALDRELAYFEAHPGEVEPTLNVRLEESSDAGGAAAGLRTLALGIIRRAYRGRASDIHLDPAGMGKDAQLLLRLRIDGVLSQARSFPPSLHEGLLASFKAMAGTDPAETRVPQDGSIWLYIGERRLQLRVMTASTPLGETIVARILDEASIKIPLERLGLMPEDHAVLTDWFRRPNGVVLVTGPTGSGKTTVLYSCISKVTRPELKLLTVEDPVEYILPGVTQLQVNRKLGVSFSTCLEAVMRMDPDVVLVGELRDAEAARGSCRAALTGHLVLTTMHAEDAVAALMRLRDWGVEPLAVASALVGISSQRLVRRLCPKCSQEEDPIPSMVARAGELASAGGYQVPDDAAFRTAVGCKECHGGYRGRAGIYGLLPASGEVKEAFVRGGSEAEIRAAAQRAGRTTMAADGIRKAVAGVTTLEEVFRVLTP